MHCVMRRGNMNLSSGRAVDLGGESSVQLTARSFPFLEPYSARAGTGPVKGGSGSNQTPVGFIDNGDSAAWNPLPMALTVSGNAVMPESGPVVLNPPRPFVHPISFISPGAEVLEKSVQAKVLHLQNKALLDSIFGNDSALTIQPAIYATDECIYVQGHTEVKQTIRVEDRGTNKPVYICSCAAVEQQALVIEGETDILIVELSTNLQVVALQVNETIVVMGCGNVDLYVGDQAPKIVMIGCNDCSVVTSKRGMYYGVEMSGCKGISLQLCLSCELLPGQDPLEMIRAEVEESVLLPDMIRAKLHEGNMTTVCDYEPEEGQELVALQVMREIDITGEANGQHLSSRYRAETLASQRDGDLALPGNPPAHCPYRTHATGQMLTVGFTSFRPALPAPGRGGPEDAQLAQVRPHRRGYAAQEVQPGQRCRRGSVRVGAGELSEPGPRCRRWRKSIDGGHARMHCARGT